MILFLRNCDSSTLLTYPAVAKKGEEGALSNHGHLPLSSFLRIESSALMASRCEGHEASGAQAVTVTAEVLPYSPSSSAEYSSEVPSFSKTTLPSASSVAILVYGSSKAL